MTLLPESSIPDDYQKFWIIDTASAKYFLFNKGVYHTGVNSLEFAGFGKNEKLETEKVVAITPEGAINIPAGDTQLSFKIKVKQGRAVKKIYISLENPKMEIPIDLSGIEREKWITIEKSISRPSASASSDQMKIEIRKEDVPEIKAVPLYIDDIVIKKIN